MTSQHPRPEDSLALAMIELDRLERERLDTETLRREALAHARSQAQQLEQLERELQHAWPRAIARARRRASGEHRRMLAYQRELGRELEREHDERLATLARQNADRRATLAAIEQARAAEPKPHPLRVAAQWLAPLAAMGMVALVGFLALHEPALAAAPSPTPLAAVAEPAEVDAITEASPATRSDAAIAISEPAANETPVALTPAPAKPVKKSSKSSKSSKKPSEMREPAIKQRTNPLVLSGGDDPLGNL